MLMVSTAPAPGHEQFPALRLMVSTAPAPGCDSRAVPSPEVNGFDSLSPRLRLTTSPQPHHQQLQQVPPSPSVDNYGGYPLHIYVILDLIIHDVLYSCSTVVIN